MMYLFIVGGLVVGIIIGVMSPLEIPPVYAKYTSVALLPLWTVYLVALVPLWNEYLICRYF